MRIMPFLLLTGLVVAFAVRAEDEHPEIKFKAGPGWQEQAVSLPAYPEDHDLVEVPLQLVGFPFRLYLDRSTLTVGQDRVSRYTAVLESVAGVRNVFYEGIRCSESEYRTYAIGTGKGFDPVRDSRWRAITDLGSDRYRMVLERRILCDVDKRARDPRDVLVAIQRNEPHQENYY